MQHLCSSYMMNFLIVKLSVVLFVFACTVVSQYAARLFSDMNTNPAPERTWSLSSKEVKALAHYSHVRTCLSPMTSICGSIDKCDGCILALVRVAISIN